jgi:hypothetical protein
MSNEESSFNRQSETAAVLNQRAVDFNAAWSQINLIAFFRLRPEFAKPGVEISEPDGVGATLNVCFASALMRQRGEKICAISPAIGIIYVPLLNIHPALL